MSAGLCLFGAVVLGLVGAWTVARPDGGYRAAGGAGSGLSPGTRRVAGFVLLGMAAAFLVLALGGGV